MTEPETKRIKAIDVVPRHWALWCSVDGGQPFANAIASAKWLDDGRLSFLLDSFNFLVADPDEELELVPLDVSEIPHRVLEDIVQRHRELVARRLTPEQLKRKKELLAERERINAELRLLEVVDENPFA